MSILLSNWRLTLLYLFIAALSLRVAFIVFLQDGFYFADSLDYTRAATNLITNGQFGETYRRAPGYPVFLAGIFTLFGSSILAIRLVESFMGAFLAVVLAELGRRVGGERVGTLAGILWSIYPLSVFIAGLVYPTALLSTLLACSVLCLMPPSESVLSRKRVLLGGIFLGLAALTKPIVLATIGVVGLWLWCWNRGRRVMLVALLIIGSSIPLVPWTVRNFQVYGSLVAVEPRLAQHLLIVRGAHGKLPDHGTDGMMDRGMIMAGRFANEFLHFWKLYPDRVAMSQPGVRARIHEEDQRVVQSTIFSPSTLINLVSILSTGPLFFFALIGTVAMGLCKARRRELTMLWTIILSFAVGYSFFFTQTRYRIPIEPYIAILSAYGLVQSWFFLRSYGWRRLTVSRDKVEKTITVAKP